VFPLYTRYLFLFSLRTYGPKESVAVFKAAEDDEQFVGGEKDGPDMGEGEWKRGRVESTGETPCKKAFGVKGEREEILLDGFALKITKNTGLYFECTFFFG